MSCRQACAQDSKLPEHDQVGSRQESEGTPPQEVCCVVSPPLYDGGEWSSHARPPLPSSVSCSCAAAQEETRKLHKETSSCSLAAVTGGWRDWAISNFLCDPMLCLVCDLYMWFCVLPLCVCVCVHSVKACQRAYIQAAPLPIKSHKPLNKSYSLD